MFASDIRTALVIGHPGHELLVHGWVEATRPIVFIFTDGSGRSSQSRLDGTTRIIRDAGARCGSIYGRLKDAEAYAAVLNHKFEVFVELARELSGALLAERIDYVAGDAFEGYNPMHDVCRLVINAAVAVAGRDTGQAPGNFEYSLTGPPDVYQETPNDNRILQVLAEAAFARKLAAAKGYKQLSGEVAAALQRTPAEAFRLECLRPVDPGVSNLAATVRPYYEQYGERQVAAGYYERVLRYHEHIAPLAEALTSCIDRKR